MADLSDVETALASKVFSVLHPNGANSQTVLGKIIRVYRGWPATSALNTDLSNGIVNVSIFSVPGDTKDTTRWGLAEAVSARLSTLSVTAANGSIILAGVPAVGQLVGVIVNDDAFSYRVQVGDTLDAIAGGLANLIRKLHPCMLAGVVLSIPNAARLIGRTVADSIVQTEWARQEQGFRISVWAPDPPSRDVVCNSIACGLAQVAFLGLSDESAGRLRYRKTAAYDEDQSAKLYRRDLIYSVEYGTIVNSAAPSFLFGDVVLDGAISPG